MESPSIPGVTAGAPLKLVGLLQKKAQEQAPIPGVTAGAPLKLHVPFRHGRGIAALSTVLQPGLH